MVHHPAPVWRTWDQHAGGLTRAGAQVRVGVADADIVIQQRHQREHAFEIFVQVRKIMDALADRGRQRFDFARLRIALPCDEIPADGVPRCGAGLGLGGAGGRRRVLGRADGWGFGPAGPYGRQGDRANAVFPCGLVHDPSSDDIRSYYGAADTSICVATAKLDALLELV